jgi:hypothetical protein
VVRLNRSPKPGVLIARSGSGDEVRNPKKAGASPVRTLQGGRVGRGDADRTGGNTPRRTRSSGARASGQGGREARGRRDREQHGRACGCARIDPTPGRERALKGRTSGGQRPRRDFRPVRYGLSAGSKALESSDASSGLAAGAARERQESRQGAERRTAPREGTKPCRRNPMSVTGMKQARTVWRGGSRRERAKRCGRKVAGPAKAREDRIRRSSCAVGEGSPGGRHPVRAIASESISG